MAATRDYTLNKIKESLIKDYDAFDFATLTVAGSAVGLDLTTREMETAKLVHIYVQSSIATRAIRYRVDGTDPASGTGIGRFDNDEFEIQGQTNLQKFKAIQEAAGTHTLHITYYR